MKLPQLYLRELIWVVLATVFAFGWWQERRASTLVSERNHALESWVAASKDAGWKFSFGKGDAVAKYSLG